MTQAEFDKCDEEVMGMVNPAAHPDAEKAAEKIAAQMRFHGDGPHKKESCCTCGVTGKTPATKNCAILALILRVIICIGVGSLFVLAMFDENFVITLANLGVLIAGCVAAIQIDRYIHRR